MKLIKYSLLIKFIIKTYNRLSLICVLLKGMGNIRSFQKMYNVKICIRFLSTICTFVHLHCSSLLCHGSIEG